MTFSEYGNFIRNVRNRIANDTPEYLPNFDELFISDQKEYSELNAQQQLQDNFKFLMDWNTFNSELKSVGITK